MSHRRKKFLSAGLAGALCSTVLFGLTTAHANTEKATHLHAVRAQTRTGGDDVAK